MHCTGGVAYLVSCAARLAGWNDAASQ